MSPTPLFKKIKNIPVKKENASYDFCEEQEQIIGCGINLYKIKRDKEGNIIFEKIYL